MRYRWAAVLIPATQHTALIRQLVHLLWSVSTHGKENEVRAIQHEDTHVLSPGNSLGVLPVCLLEVFVTYMAFNRSPYRYNCTTMLSSAAS